MKGPQEPQHGFEFPPDAQRYLVWSRFLRQWPTTIFWSALAYVVVFTGLTVVGGLTEVRLEGLWLGLYFTGAMIWVVTLYVAFSGWLRRRMG